MAMGRNHGNHNCLSLLELKLLELKRAGEPHTSGQTELHTSGQTELHTSGQTELHPSGQTELHASRLRLH